MAPHVIIKIVFFCGVVYGCTALVFLQQARTGGHWITWLILAIASVAGYQYVTRHVPGMRDNNDRKD